jgi:sarcosine oxidase subunit beta
MMAPFGLALDITPLWLHCGYTTPIARDEPMPLTIDLDTGLIIEREGDGACVTVSDTSFGAGGATAVMEAFAELAHVRAPRFTYVGIRTTTSAAFDATGGDGHAYAGEVEPGLWVFAGFDGHGTMQGPALAELLAGLMAGRTDPVIDMAHFDPWRTSATTQEWIRAAKR